MVVQLLGKELRSGTAKKTGKPYTAVIAYLAYKADGVHGVKCSNIFLSPEKYPFESLVVGAQYNIVMGLDGYLQSFALQQMPKQSVKTESEE